MAGGLDGISTDSNVARGLSWSHELYGYFPAKISALRGDRPSSVWLAIQFEQLNRMAARRTSGK